MLGFIIATSIQALLLMLAVGTVGGVKRAENTFPTAAIAALVLSGVGWMLGKLGLFGFVVWPLAWMFAVKSVYDIGWFRAAAIGVFLVGVIAVLLVFLAATVGLTAVGLGILL